MKPTRILLPALLASPLLLALEPRGDALSFHPAKASSLTKTTQIEVSFELGDITMIVSGNDMSGQIPGDVAGAMDMSTTWTDKYVDLKDGKPLELIRSYDEMSGTMDMNGGGDSNSSEIPEFDALSGKSIRFKWNEEKQEYDIAYHECEGEEKLLKSQQIDMDYRMLLPTKEVAVGDKWEVPAEFMRQMLEGVKNSDMGEDEAGIGAIVQDELFPQLDKLLDKFKTTCEYKGRRDEEGVDVGVIAIALEGSGSLDLKSMLEAIASEQMPPGQDIEFDIGEASMALNLTGKGEVLWNIASGHLLSAVQEVDFTVNFVLDASVSAQGQDQSIEAEVELPGKFKQTMSVKK